LVSFNAGGFNDPTCLTWHWARVKRDPVYKEPAVPAGSGTWTNNIVPMNWPSCCDQVMVDFFMNSVPSFDEDVERLGVNKHPECAGLFDWIHETNCVHTPLNKTVPKILNIKSMRLLIFAAHRLTGDRELCHVCFVKLVNQAIAVFNDSGPSVLRARYVAIHQFVFWARQQLKEAYRIMNIRDLKRIPIVEYLN
jgi:hypothetical protein